MNETKEFCEMSTLIRLMSVDCSFTLSVVYLFCMKLSIQAIINSKCVFCVNYESIFLSTRDHTFRSRSSSAELSFYSCSYFIQCEFASWKSSTSFRKFFFDVHSFMFRRAVYAFSLNCWFVWQWLISMSFLKCWKMRWVCTSWDSCNYFYLISSKKWCAFF
jgi:hypothetical protein